ncbi:MAG: adenylate/guanylate cyclase domain-containing protein [Methylophilaceae bacterium]|nr:adenylate/guanylate cyclase domain-containing protein [Methylophilaceae bacterium]
MNERLNKTSICSVVFLDIVGYSQKPVEEQIELKDRFNQLLSEALAGVAPADRIVLDTGDGAAIALMGAPEDALFIALSVRDGIIDGRGWDRRGGGIADNVLPTQVPRRDKPLLPLEVRIGINLGPVRVVNDINGRPNIIGDGINVAQRVMSFAQPNQILVSRSYYEVTSRLTSELTQMFVYSGVKQDKHVREHEVYAVMPTKNGQAGDLQSQGDSKPVLGAHLTRRTVMLGTTAVLAITGVGMLLYFWNARMNPPLSAPSFADRQMETAPSPRPVEPAQTVPPQAASQPPVKKAQQSDVPSSATRKSADRKNAKPKRSDTATAQSTTSTPDAPAERTTDTPKKQDGGTESGWEKFKRSIKQGRTTPECTAAQRSLNQCR